MSGFCAYSFMISGIKAPMKSSVFCCKEKDVEDLGRTFFRNVGILIFQNNIVSTLRTFPKNYKKSIQCVFIVVNLVLPVARKLILRQNTDVIAACLEN
jgi:hypothetical protein